ncbi:hypothetical protein BDN71DRAFT_1437459, partial [Pleurotus eryngii]
AADDTDNYDLNAGKDTEDADTDNHAGDAGDDIEDVRDDVHNHVLDIGYDSDDTSRNAAQIDDNTCRDGVTGEGCLELEVLDDATFWMQDTTVTTPQSDRLTMPQGCLVADPLNRSHRSVTLLSDASTLQTESMKDQAKKMPQPRRWAVKLGPCVAVATDRRLPYSVSGSVTDIHRLLDLPLPVLTNGRTLMLKMVLIKGGMSGFGAQTFALYILLGEFWLADTDHSRDEGQWFGIDRDAEGHGDNGDTLGDTLGTDNDKASDDDVLKGSQDGTSGDDEKDGQDSSADRNGKYSARDGDTSVEEEEEEEDDKEEEDNEEDDEYDKEDEDNEEEDEEDMSSSDEDDGGHGGDSDDGGD